MSRSPLITVLTPTYNRVRTLPRVFESLKAQSSKDFEWLIVDDGSSDHTGSLVEGWLREAPFDIRYLRQMRGHKKVAVNRGARHARGELIAVLDDDDEALPDSLSSMSTEWTAIPVERRKLFCGVVGLCVSAEPGRVIGDRFPSDVMECNLLDSFYRHRVRGEKWGCFRTDLLRRYPYPEYVEGYVPESVVWFAVARNYLTKCVNVPLRRHLAEPDSVTASLTRACGPIASAEGMGLWAKETLSHDWAWARHDPIWFFKMAVNYTRWRLHMGGVKRTRQGRLSGVPQMALVWLAGPVGVVRFLVDLVRCYLGNLWARH